MLVHPDQEWTYTVDRKKSKERGKRRGKKEQETESRISRDSPKRVAFRHYLCRIDDSSLNDKYVGNS